MSASATQGGHKQSGIPVDKYVGMVCTPLQRSKLHDWYKPAKIIDLGFLVFTVDHSRQIEQLGTLHTASNAHKDSRKTLNRLLWRLSRELTALTVTTKLTTATDKNSSGDEIANVNFYAVRPETTRIRWNNAIMPFKVTDFGTNRKLIYDFLLVINTNLPPILHLFGDIAVDRSEIAILGYSSCV